MKFITAMLLAATLATSAIAQPAPSAPTEYTLTVSPEELNAIGRGIDELPAKIANPLSQKLLGQIQAQNKAREEAQKPKTDDSGNQITPK